MAVTKTLELRFGTADGRITTLRVPEPKEGLTPAEVQTAMETIIAKNVFTSSGGDFAIVDSARIVERSTTAIIGE